MNSFGHAVMAAEILRDRGFMFGAILPDLMGFLPLSPPVVHVESVLFGIEHHKSIDEHFHGLSTFQQALLALSPRLQAAQVRRGVSRAAAHVGLEFFVDGHLAQDEPTIIHWTTFLDSILEGGFRDLASFSGEQEAHHVLDYFQRQRRHPHPSTDPAVVAHRVARALGRRPRLRLSQEDLSFVEIALRAAGDEMSQSAQRILTELRLTFRYRVPKSGPKGPSA